MNKGRVAFPLRVAIGSLFAVSGFLKLIAPEEAFRAAVESYKILSGAPAGAAAIGIPWGELLGGVFLAIGLWSRASLAVLWALNSVFLAAVVSAIARGLSLKDCGCFGPAESGFSLTPLQVLSLDAVLWLAFAWLFFGAASALRKGSVDSFLDRS